MRIFREITKKPWLSDQGMVEDLHDGSLFAMPSARLGLRVFVTVVTVVFTLIIVSYISRRTLSDWSSVPEPALLWLNTGLLFLSSVAMQWARTSARRGDLGGVKNGLFAGGLLTLAFLAGQLFAWQQLGYNSANPASVFFYLLTALHGLHLLGGLIAWIRTTAKVSTGSEAADVRLSVELCAFYWHFLLLVWLILFGLLLAT